MARQQANKTVVVGVGYTGRRILTALPLDAALAVSRSPDPACGDRLLQVDLDTDTGLPATAADLFGAHYAVVYSVPPVAGESSDPRLVRLLDALPALPDRFIYFSTTGVYGDCGGRRVAETERPNPQTDRALRRVVAEQQLQRWSEDNAVPLVILRIPGIYGPGRLGLGSIRNGRALIRESEANPGNRIHVDDLVRCCMAALRPDVSAGIYNVGDGDERSSTWFAQETARQAGLKQPPTVRRIEAEQLFSTGRLSFLRESRRLDLTKLHAILKPGIRYTDAADGIAASLKAG
jgi:nucleoside-diphosphate-sugar epimerase